MQLLTKNIEMKQEIWKSINNYEGLYEVSNMGQVKSLAKLDSKNNHRKEIILNDRINSRGYKYTSLYKNSEVKQNSVHRLVAQAFIQNHNNLPQVNHKDGNKLNNHVDNLEWVTAKDNIVHAYRTGLAKAANGESQGHSKLIAQQVVEIYHASGRYREIAAKYGVFPTVIGKIKRGEIWSHVAKYI